MALIRRMTRLFRADFHAVLDRVEEPDILLRQAIREMEDELARDEHACTRHETEREQLMKKEEEFNALLASLGEELDVCFAADKEDLARSLIRRRLETERALQLLGQRRDGLETRITQLRRRLADNRTHYESMRQKAELFDEQKAPTESPGNWPAPDIRVRDEDVEVALLKERQRRTAS